ncbi:MAG: outer membrane lipoprotein-sorting protein, partial [Bacteroidales bacterium]|nr:outer membrane lipoprotein-sorting protein [Bacteroidales bacterium]
MKRIIVLSIALSLSFIMTGTVSAQLTAAQILEKVDNNLNAAKDQTLYTTITLIDKAGKTSTRTMTMIQKGSDKRLVKFLTPADQKGIGFLSLPNDNLTIYLPAFGKTRKIASSVKNTKFAGTDYSYEDMEAKKYSSKWIPKLLKTENGNYVLELTLKSGMTSDYSKLIMYARTSDCYPVMIVHYDKGGKLYKTISASKIEKVGDYLIGKETTLTD